MKADMKSSVISGFSEKIRNWILITKIEGFCHRHSLFLRKTFYIVGTLAIVFSCIEIPREIYRMVRSHEYYSNLDNENYWPVQDYDGNNVNIFEYEHYLESCGATDIIKGYYYKDNGNTAICYDYNVGNVRLVLDNVITPDYLSTYNSGSRRILVQSRLSVYDGNYTYITDYVVGENYVMDYRSPMWVEKRVFESLHTIMDRLRDDAYKYSECPFDDMDIPHYVEDVNGNHRWHQTLFDVDEISDASADNTTIMPDNEYTNADTGWPGYYVLENGNYIEVFDTYSDGTIYFGMSTMSAAGDEFIYNEYTVPFNDTNMKEIQIEYQSGIYEIFKLDDDGISVSLSNGMPGANDGFYKRTASY